MSLMATDERYPKVTRHEDGSVSVRMWRHHAERVFTDMKSHASEWVLHKWSGYNEAADGPIMRQIEADSIAFADRVLAAVKTEVLR